MAAFTIKDVTVKERILLHLARFSNVLPGQIYNVPFDLTQDGIAMVVGITRAHASIDLKKLGETGLVMNWLAHQKGARSKRLVYSITKEGMTRAEESKDRLIQEGIDIDVLLDMRRCDPETKWNSLTDADREVFGRVCVLRVPVPRDTFPPTPSGVLPTDVAGMTSIPRETSLKYLEKVSMDTVRGWHSWAADYWLDKNDVQERLYHLVEAGRTAEAGKYARSHEHELVSNPNEDLLRSLGIINQENPGNDTILWMRSRVAYACKSLDALKACLKDLHKLNSPMAELTQAQIDILKEDYWNAAAVADGVYQQTHHPAAAMLLAKAQLCMGDTDGAERTVIDAIDAMERIGDVTYLDEVLRARAEIAYSRGDKQSAVALLGKAKAAAPDYKKHDLQFLADAISKPGTAVSFI